MTRRLALLGLVGFAASCGEELVLPRDNVMAVGSSWTIPIAAACTHTGDDCDHMALTEIVAVVDKDPSIFDITNVAPNGFTLQAVRAGKTLIQVVALDELRNVRTAEADFEAVDVTGVSLWGPHDSGCESARGPERVETYVPVSTELIYSWSYSGGQRSGGSSEIHGYLPFATENLTEVSAGRFRTSSEVGVVATIRLPQVPSFVETIVTYDAGDIDHLTLAGSGFWVNGIGSFAARATIGDEPACFEAFERQIQILSPDVCRFSEASPTAMVTTRSDFTAFGVAPGMCVIHVALPELSLEKEIAVPVTVAPPS